MEKAVNPALQAILDSLNEPSSWSSESPSIDHESSSIIPGLRFVPLAEPPKIASSKPETPQPTSRTMTPALAPIPDASGITSWPAGLKHVTRYIAQNEVITTKIRQLIAEQHKHEKQWWAGREAIIKKHQSRGDNQQQAADLLKSIGGIPTTLRPITEASQKADLDAYDKKVYGEFVKMTSNYDRQLRALGIPFYAIKHDLVILAERPDGASTTGRIDRGELRELQRRMLQHLEDLLL